MKKLLFILLACLPLFGMAKDKKDNSDPKYLAGAITMEDGKVTFNHEIKAPSLSKEQLYQQMLDWANNRFKSDGKLQSRVVYTNEEEGDIAASAEEYIVFSSSALSLDRTRIYYQYLINVADGVCRMTMTRIRYWYDENRDGGEKYTAEEWITDDMALNKKKTKLAPICGKFRRETIDLKDWLDPNNTGAQFVDGIPVPEPEPDPDPYVIHINGSFYQLNCPLLENQKVTVDHWGGAYDVCKNQEVVLEFTSNKKNLTCSLWDGTGPFYLQYFPRGDYYTLSCTPQSDIFELSFTDGNITEYIAFETQDYYTISYSNSSQLIQIDINEDMARMKNSSSYKVAIYNQTGSLMKQVSMANKTISINTTEFPNGIYFIHLMDNTGEKIGSKKISISH